MSLTNVSFPEAEKKLLHSAAAYYGFENLNQFFRAAGRALIEHYHHRHELSSPLKFYGNGQFEEEIARLDTIVKDLQVSEDPMASVLASFSGSQWAAVEKLRAADAQTIHRLMIRIQELEGCLVYCRNFLPESLKEQAGAILFHGREDTAIQPAQ